MRFEVEIKILTKDTNSDTLRSIRQTWEFGDNEKWRLAGEDYVIKETANILAGKIRDELIGSDSWNLNETSGSPRKA